MNLTFFIATSMVAALLTAVWPITATAQTSLLLWKVSLKGADGKPAQLGTVGTELFPPRQPLQVDTSGNVFVAGRVYVNSMGIDVNSVLTVKLDALGNEVWRATTTAGTGNDGGAVALAMDNSGNVFVLANEHSSTLSERMFLLKYDGNGMELWRALADVGDAARALRVDGSGNAYVTGKRSGGGFVTAKYLANGTRQWQSVIVGQASSEPVDIALDATGNVFVVGRSPVGNDILTVKYANGGTELWRATTNGSGNSVDTPFALTIDSTGSALVAAQSGVSPAADYLTFKLDANSGESWRQTLNSNFGALDLPRAVATDETGAVYVSGSGQNTPGNDDFITVKYDAMGIEQWRVALNSASSLQDQAFAITVDANQNVYVSGFGYGSGSTVQGLAVRYSAAGVEQWRTTSAVAVDGRENWKAIALGPANSVYIAGSAVPFGQNSALIVRRYSQTGPLVPGAPRNFAATGSVGQILFSFEPPVSDGGSAITQYKVDCGAGVALNAPSSPIVIVGLVNNTSYTCTVLARNGVGDGALSTAIVVRTPSPPDAPDGVQAGSGNSLASVSFGIPISDGGAAVTTYTATCQPGNISVSGLRSPLVVKGLTNGESYSCTVIATNAVGNSPASTLATVVPSAAATAALISVESRKMHGSVVYGIPLTLSVAIDQSISIEPRWIGDGHRIVFQFGNDVTSTGTVSAVNGVGENIPVVLSGLPGDELTLTLPVLSANSRVTLTMGSVNGGAPASASVGFLVGDFNSSRVVSASDIAVLKSRVGHAVSLGNFRFDLNLTGTINSSDITAIKAQSGMSLQ